MYRNAGKSIKAIVIALVIVGMVLSVLAGLLIMGIAGMKGLLLGLIVIIIGCIFAWLSGLLVYAYGDIADNLLVMRRIMVQQAAAMLDENEMDAEEMTSASSPAHNDSGEQDAQVPVENCGEPWVCRFCGTENRSIYCSKCYSNKEKSMEMDK